MRKDGLFTKIPADKIRQMRQLKMDGYSLFEIAKQLDCAKSTVSLYCRDLFLHPLRKYDTEAAYRGVLAERQVGKDRSGKHFCIDCNAKISSGAKRCVACSRKHELERLEFYAFSGRKANCHQGNLGKDRRLQTIAVKMTEKPKRTLPPIISELCPASPNKVHHWDINSSDWGVCRYCKKSKQFGGLSANQRSHP